jgi:arylsulfatase A
MKYLVRLILAISFMLVGAIRSPSCLADSKPNVILILADDMGIGDPHCYNVHSRIETPNIDRLANQGVMFTDAHAAGALCHPSRYGLLTGNYPFRTDVSRWPTEPLIRPGQTTIASLMQRQGYATAMIGKWHLGFWEQGYEKPLRGGPVDVGFDSFFGLRASTDIPPYFLIRNNLAESAPSLQIPNHHSPNTFEYQGAFWRGGGIAPNLRLEDVLPKLTEEAIEVLQQHTERKPSQPLFMYWALTGPHTPWLPSKEFQGKSNAGLYGDFTMMIDAMIGRVLDSLDELKMSDNTLVLFSSDNGPIWYPEDITKTGHRSAGPWRGMKSSNWEGGHRVPFVIRWPAKVRPGSVSNKVLCFTDVLATLAELVEAPLPEAAGLDSFSFLSDLIERPSVPNRSRESLLVGKSLRMGEWKWIEGREQEYFLKPNSKKYPPPEEPANLLYRLSDDPDEQKNVCQQFPEIAKKMQLEYDRILGSERTRP